MSRRTTSEAGNGAKCYGRRRFVHTSISRGSGPRSPLQTVRPPSQLSTHKRADSQHRGARCKKRRPCRGASNEEMPESDHQIDGRSCVAMARATERRRGAGSQVDWQLTQSKVMIAAGHDHRRLNGIAMHNGLLALALLAGSALVARIARSCGRSRPLTRVAARARRLAGLRLEIGAERRKIARTSRPALSVAAAPVLASASDARHPGEDRQRQHRDRDGRHQPTASRRALGIGRPLSCCALALNLSGP